MPAAAAATVRARPTKPTADHVTVRVSPRTADGETRAYVGQHGRRCGITHIGLILTDDDRRRLIEALGGVYPAPVGDDRAPRVHLGPLDCVRPDEVHAARRGAGA